MSKKFNKLSVLTATSVLGFLPALVSASSVFAADATAAAGGDRNADDTQPQVNPSINWGAPGAATGSVSQATGTSGTSLAGISWHTTQASAVLSLLRVPNFDFGAWDYTGGAKSNGTANSFYPASAAGGPFAYSSGGVTGNANFASLQATAPKVNTSTVNGISKASAPTTDSNRVLEVSDMRAGTGGWKVQLQVGSFDRDGDGDNSVTGGTSPTAAGVSHLSGAAIYISYYKAPEGQNAAVPGADIAASSTNFLPNPKAPTGVPNIAYSADTRGTPGSRTGANPNVDPNATGYNYGDAVTILKADQGATGNKDNGQGKWFVDFSDKNSAYFTSPVEGLGTYTASLKWTLSTGPGA